MKIHTDMHTNIPSHTVHVRLRDCIKFTQEIEPDYYIAE